MQNLNFKESSERDFKIVDDDSLSIPHTPDENEFNSTTRDYLLVSVFSLLVYSFSFKQIYKYIHPSERISHRSPTDERIIQTIAYNVAALSFTLAIFFVLVLPFSMVSNELLLLSAYHPTAAWYLQWLSPELFSALWKIISIFSNISLYVLIPFCYFFLESEATLTAKLDADDGGHATNSVSQSTPTRKTHQQDFRDRCVNYFRHLCSRFCQTLTIFCLFYAILALMTAILSNFKISYIDLPRCFHEGYTFLSLCLLLLSAPRGYQTIFQRAQDLLENPIYLRKQASLIKVQIQIDTLKRAIARSEQPITSSTQKQQDNINQLKQLEIQAKELRKKIPLFKKLIYPLTTALMILLPLFAVIISLYHICELFFVRQVDSIAFFKSKFFKKLTVFIFGEKIKQGSRLRLGEHSLSYFGPIGTIVEALLVPYLYFSSVYGFYTLPIFKKIRPSKNGTGLQLIIVNCAIILTMSSALPLLCRTLDFVEPHDTVNPTRRGSRLVEENFYVVVSLNLIFGLSTSYTLFVYLQKNFIKLYNSIRLQFQTTPTHPPTSTTSTTTTTSTSTRHVTTGKRRLSWTEEDDIIPSGMMASVTSLKLD